MYTQTNTCNTACAASNITASSTVNNLTTAGMVTSDIKKEFISDIKIIVPNKVVEVTFEDGFKEKLVCHKDDKFDLERCCFIAIAKHLYKKEYTCAGIEYKAGQLMYQKKYVKIVKKALNEYRKKLMEENKAILKENEEKKIRKRQQEKRKKKKQIRAEQNRQYAIDLISDAIVEAKLRTKLSKKEVKNK